MNKLTKDEFIKNNELDVEAIRKFWKQTEREMVARFFHLEALEYYPKNRYFFIMNKVYPAVMEIIEEHADDHVIFNSMTNLGQLARSLTVDCFSEEPKGTSNRGDIIITFCSCGSHVTIEKYYIQLVERDEPIEGKSRYKRTQKTVSLVKGKCYNNKLWNEFKEERG